MDRRSKRQALAAMGVGLAAMAVSGSAEAQDRGHVGAFVEH